MKLINENEQVNIRIFQPSMAEVSLISKKW